MIDFLAQSVTLPVWLGALLMFVMPWLGVAAYRLGQMWADYKDANLVDSRRNGTQGDSE